MPQVERETVKRRAAELRTLAKATRDRWLASLVDKPHSVLAERDTTGYTPHFARVAVPEGTPAGAIVSMTPTQIENGLLQ
jgi:threonylcarbamoyladenosine tRNA methylthiotransferase MtaB